MYIVNKLLVFPLFPPALMGEKHKIFCRKANKKENKMSKETLSARVEAIKEELNGFLTEDQIKKMVIPGVESNSLPETGKFSTFEKSGEGDFKHLRMRVANGMDSVSLSNLRLVAPLKGTEPEFDKISKEGSPLKGKYYLKGKSVNPQFAQFSPLELIAHLEGRKFEAKKIEVHTLRYLKEGHSLVTAKANLLVKEAYVVTLVD